MALPALRAALERYFDALRLSELCREALGLDVAALGDTDELGRRIDGLLHHCEEQHLLEALIDAVCVCEPAARESIANDRAVQANVLPLAADDQWGPFRIQALIGRGPTGDCYQATRGDEPVRLKVLKVATDPSTIQRVLTHARLQNRLTTAGLPRNIQAGAVDGQPFIVSDWQPGNTLQQVLAQDGPLPVERAIRVACDVLQTLQQLHQAGMSAGSLKPSNLLLASTDGEAIPILLDLSSNLMLGKPSDPSDDLIALTNILYEMLSGSSAKPSVVVPPSAAGGAQLIAPELDELVVSLLSGKLAISDAAELRERLQNVNLSGTSSDEMIERLLESSEASGNRTEKAALLHKIGGIYERERNDGDQALVAYIQAVCEDPLAPAHAASVARVAGQNPERWHDVLAAAGEAVSVLEPPERKVLLLHLGGWALRLQQADTAFSAFEAALELEPSNETAGNALEQFHRDRQQWSELRTLLLRRSREAQSPERAAELAVAAAEVAEQRLQDPVSAIQDYARVLQGSPRNERAFQALSRHYEKDQDFTNLRDLFVKRAQASSGAAAATLHLRVAELSERQLKDLAAARAHFELALQNDDTSKEAWLGLERVLVEQKETQPLLDLLTQRLSFASTPRERLELLLRCATVYEQDLLDPQRAIEALTQVLAIDPRHAPAKAALIANHLRAAEKHHAAGELDLAAEHFRLALDLDADQLVALKGLSIIELQQGDAQATLVLLEKQASLSAGRGSPTTVLDLLTPLLDLVPNDIAAPLMASRLAFEQGTPAQAIALHERLLQRHREALSSDELAAVTLRLGESLNRAGFWQRAIPPLEEAADLLPSAREPLDALVRAHTEIGDWQGVLKAKERLLDLSDGTARADLLAEIAVITSDKLSDKSDAIRKLVTALEDKPDDRKLLTRLMSLYSDGKEWRKLLDVVSKLESLTDSPDQKIKYLLTLAMVCQRELNDSEQALDFYGRVLALDPKHSKAGSESLNLSLQLGKLETAERLLTEQLQRAQQANSHGDLLAVFLQLGALYKDRLQRVDAAIDAFEAAQTLDPQNVECFQALDALYGGDLDRYRDKAIALHTAQLHHNPFTPEPYQQLRRLYTGLRRADPAWCLCRTLNALSLSSAEEDQFYERLHTDEAVALENPLGPEDWQLLLHPDADPLLTAIFSILEPVVLRLRAVPIPSLGYEPQAAIDIAGSQHPGAQALLYIAGVLDQPLPLVFDNTSLAEPLALLATEPVSIVMGGPFVDLNTPTQSLVFTSARALCGLLPGLRLRHFLSSGTGFKSWLLAAIRLNTPAFPIPAELVGPVEEAHSALREALPPQARDDLARLIAKVLQSPDALDVKRWQAGVDFSADRVGFLLANDLRTAIETIRAGQAELTSMQASRIKELVLFSVDERYFELRKRLHVAVD